MAKIDYYNLFELSPLPMWVFDVGTLQFLSVNLAAIRQYGFNMGEFLSMTINDIRPSEDAALIEAIVEKNAINGGLHKDTYTHIKKSGEYITVNIESSPVDFEGRNARLVIAIDITEQIQNEVQIRDSIERYNIVSKATSDTIWDMSLTANTIVWNKGIRGIFKHKKVDTTTSIAWWEDHIHPEDRERVLSKMAHHIKDHISRWSDEYRFVCGDGTYKHVFDRGFLMFDSNGKPYRMIGAMEDITKRKDEEHWSKLLESVVINTSDGVLIINSDRDPGPFIIYVNDAFIKMSGFSEAELLGSETNVFFGGDTSQIGLQQMNYAVQNGLACNIDLINYTKSGHEYHVNIDLSPVTDSTGMISHWVSIHRDITENKKYIKAIEEQNKTLKEIGWMQSHTVRAPLTRIMALVDLLQNQAEGDDSQELLTYLSSSAKELDGIIIDIAKNTSI
ncbi:PAS domain S-box protein [Pedobacter metabolipauper]|uniref:histidine kinase n=1 Tax=Pedobacter metabolipauper TaxID=425513 RepID=A0A4R6SSH9_9SPHI|nr:PAS domain S-box protein [Pedobacter metabolipauper]TDQ06703.1 PAS domain S-box-containing protein [Pedobacter metabolipauper]